MLQCQKCGLGLDAPYEETPPTENNRSHQTRLRLGLRLLAAISLGAAVLSISLCRLSDTAVSEGARPQQWLTQYFLEEIRTDLTKYETKFGSPPKSLRELLTLSNALENVNSAAQGQPSDGWKRPFLFTNVGSKLIALSYGRDGKPGGKGLDFDLTTTNIFDAQGHPTFSQFLYTCRPVE